MKIVVLYTQMWNIISNRLRESVPAGRRKLRREFRLPIVYNFLQLSTVGLISIPRLCLEIR